MLRVDKVLSLHDNTGFSCGRQGHFGRLKSLSTSEDRIEILYCVRKAQIEALSLFLRNGLDADMTTVDVCALDSFD